MKTFVIAFQFFWPDHVCPLFWTRLSELGAVPELQNHWRLETTLNAAQIEAEFRVFLDSQDRLLVTEILS